MVAREKSSMVAQSFSGRYPPWVQVIISIAPFASRRIEDLVSGTLIVNDDYRPPGMMERYLAHYRTWESP